MKKRTYLIALVAAAILVALAVSLRTEGGGMMRRLAGAVHGR